MSLHLRLYAAGAAAFSFSHPQGKLLNKSSSIKCLRNSMCWILAQSNSLKSITTLGSQKVSPKYSTLASMLASTQVVEHVVLFKVKPETPSNKTEAMLDGLRGLRGLDGVLQLTVAPALKLWPAHISCSAGFTHVLHSRFQDKASLDAYFTSPAHVGIVVNNVNPITDDLLVLDWEASPSPGGEEGFTVIHIVLLKLKGGLTVEDMKEVSETLNTYSNACPSVVQLSAGPNFAPARAQGFNYGFLAQFKSVKQLEELSANSNVVALVEVKLKPYVESFILVDVLKEIPASPAKM